MKKPGEISSNALKAKITSANDHQVNTNIPKKIQQFTPIQNLCNKRQQKWKSSFTLMIII